MSSRTPVCRCPGLIRARNWKQVDIATLHDLAYVANSYMARKPLQPAALGEDYRPLISTRLTRAAMGLARVSRVAT